MTKLLNVYMKSISKFPLLTREEEENVAKNGNIEVLINSNLRLVVSLANKYSRKGVSLQELIQEGNLGLIQAAQKYDVTKGFRFSTYATWWIKRGILRALHLYYANKEIPSEYVESSNDSSYDILDDIINFELKEKVDKLLESLLKAGKLKEKQIKVFKARMYLENTLEEIGKELKVTRERIRQIEAKTLNIIKNNIEELNNE